MSEFDVHNPADGRLVGSVADWSADDVAAAVATLRENQPAWEARGIADRARWLRKLRDWLLDHADEIADTVQAETGRPRAEAGLEATYVAEVINYWCANAKGFLAEETPRPFGPLQQVKRLRQVYRPHPVVGVITPWNFPLVMPGGDSVPALIAGCAVIVKPSEVTPLSALQLARGWEEIGAPPVLTVATGQGATGAALVDAVDFVQFTGSTATGRAIAQAAGARLVPYSLELGGKDPAIVLADADLDKAVGGIAWGGMMNSGQVCVSTERVYVEAPVYEEFVARLTEKVGSLRQGVDDPAYSQDVGPLANEAQAKIVQEHVEQAVEAGAKVLTGGKRTGVGTFFEPTVLVDVDHSMACMREETFGPTLPVMKVADADEAVRMANDSSYGLSATVWTRDEKSGERLARRLEVGAVNINDSMANLFSFPLAHSGWKASGIGARFGGASGVRKYCRAQAITSARMPTPTNPVWYPYAAGRMRLLAHVASAVASRDPLRLLGIRRGPRV